MQTSAYVAKFVVAMNFKIIISLLITFLLAGCRNGKESAEIQMERPFENVKPGPQENETKRIKVRNIGGLQVVFNDSNSLQLKAARALGIKPISNISSAYFTSRPLVKIESNEYYVVDSLTHSVPYLVPEAALLLEDIGKSFIDSLKRRGGDHHLIKVTSLLRTPESVTRLRRVNVNATDSSTHQYATTFDLSYSKFYCSDPSKEINQSDLKNLLAEVLLDLRNNGRCLVKYERKTNCFHVTVMN